MIYAHLFPPQIKVAIKVGLHLGKIVSRLYAPRHRWIDRGGDLRWITWVGKRLIKTGAGLMQVCRQTRDEVTPLFRENTSFLVRERELAAFEDVFGACDSKDSKDNIRYSRRERNDKEWQDENYVLVKVRGPEVTV